MITFIHEFSAYIKPKQTIIDVGLWSNKVVFSSNLTKTDILSACPQVANIATRVLPQGKCVLPTEMKKYEKERNIYPLEDIDRKIEHTRLILGAGTIQPRKGIDIFVSVAERMQEYCRNNRVRFVWIGSGYNPEWDYNVRSG